MTDSFICMKFPGWESFQRKQISIYRGLSLPSFLASIIFHYRLPAQLMVYNVASDVRMIVKFWPLPFPKEGFGASHSSSLSLTKQVSITLEKRKWYIGMIFSSGGKFSFIKFPQIGNISQDCIRIKQRLHGNTIMIQKWQLVLLINVQ